MSEKLWAVHVQGPDDIIAMPNEAAAVSYAATLNHFFKTTCWADDMHIAALVTDWPYNEISHREALKESAATPIELGKD